MPTNWKRFALALAAAFFCILVVDILWNAVLLHRTFIETAQYWRPAEELNRLVPLGFLIMLFITGVTGLIFVRLGARGMRRGLELGVLLGVSAFVGTLGFATLVPWPLHLLMAMGFQALLNSIIAGATFGWLYHERTTASDVSTRRS